MIDERPVPDGDVAAEDAYMAKIVTATEREAELEQEHAGRPWSSYGDGAAQEAADHKADRDAEPVPKKRRKGTSPTARTLAECRKRGWIAQVVERYNPHAHVLVDLFGVIDLVVIVPRADGRPASILGIQATANNGGTHAARRDKIVAEPRAAQWVEAGARLELWSWAKQGKAGKRKVWTLRVETYEQMYEQMCDATNEECAF